MTLMENCVNDGALFQIINDYFRFLIPLRQHHTKRRSETVGISAIELKKGL